jgi:hypothetical protein
MQNSQFFPIAPGAVTLYGDLPQMRKGLRCAPEQLLTSQALKCGPQTRKRLLAHASTPRRLRGKAETITLHFSAATQTTESRKPERRNHENGAVASRVFPFSWFRLSGFRDGSLSRQRRRAAAVLAGQNMLDLERNDGTKSLRQQTVLPSLRRRRNRHRRVRQVLSWDIGELFAARPGPCYSGAYVACLPPRQPGGCVS